MKKNLLFIVSMLIVSLCFSQATTLSKQHLADAVSFASFHSERKTSSSVYLTWTTALELDSKGFYVQRNNGEGWKDVGFVFSQTEDGNSLTSMAYAFKDINAEKRSTQYRILHVDNNGNGKYSDTCIVPGEIANNKLALMDK